MPPLPTDQTTPMPSVSNGLGKASRDVRALVLFSGGLDSILACRVLEEQGIGVTALKFITPFFGWTDPYKRGEEEARLSRQYSITVKIIDITGEYLEMLRAPRHGYGRFFNPCMDCKILMISKALSLLEPMGADFVATGEVIGQRPMSQRRDALNVIERESGAEGRLLRPLCARHMRQTKMEEEGLVDRRRLLGISGRGRKEQIALATRYGIEGYPTPAGGCVLADPILSKRLRRLTELWPTAGHNDYLLAQVGRHFLLRDAGLLVVGRNRRENRRIMELALTGDLLLNTIDRPGPTGLWRRPSMELAQLAAGILARYAKGEDLPDGIRFKGEQGEFTVSPSLITQGELDQMRF